MTTLPEIERAAEQLAPAEQEALLRFLAARGSSDGRPRQDHSTFALIPAGFAMGLSQTSSTNCRTIFDRACWPERIIHVLCGSGPGPTFGAWKD